MDSLVECSTSILDDVCIHEDDTSDYEIYLGSLVCPYRLLGIYLTQQLHETIATNASTSCNPL